jgi:hypothetical protein
VTDSARVTNLAVRTVAGSGDAALFVGFSIAGQNAASAQPLLIRAVGPTLAGFGVTGILDDPRLQIFDGPRLLFENDDWRGDELIAAATPRLGAFALAGAASRDAALLASYPVGSYTVQIRGPEGESGIVLAEIYDGLPPDAVTAASPRLVNVSARTRVGTGGNLLIAGFAIRGATAKTILVRAIGPSLAAFGVSGVLADPKLELYRSGGDAPISVNDNWGASAQAAEIAATAAAIGAFPLALESRDAVLLLTLPAGTYTAQVSGVNNTGGTAIVEVYDVP